MAQIQIIRAKRHPESPLESYAFNLSAEEWSAINIGDFVMACDTRNGARTTPYFTQVVEKAVIGTSIENKKILGVNKFAKPITFPEYDSKYRKGQKDHIDNTLRLLYSLFSLADSSNIKESEMTNREWINSCTDSDFLDWLITFADDTCTCCEIDPTGNSACITVIAGNKPDFHCKSGWKRWLAAKHKEVVDE